jgi:hypothetical protein
MVAHKTSNAGSIEILRALTASRGTERALHYHFKHLRTHDSFYNFAPEMLTITPEELKVPDTEGYIGDIVQRRKLQAPGPLDVTKYYSETLQRPKPLKFHPKW